MAALRTLQKILDVVHEKGPITRADIMNEIGSKKSYETQNYLNMLEAEGDLVYYYGAVPGSRKPARYYATRKQVGHKSVLTLAIETMEILK